MGTPSKHIVMEIIVSALFLHRNFVENEIKLLTDVTWVRSKGDAQIYDIVVLLLMVCCLRAESVPSIY